jgi:hypothetical protein
MDDETRVGVEVDRLKRGSGRDAQATKDLVGIKLLGNIAPGDYGPARYEKLGEGGKPCP